jgi:hypothetical protein
MDFKAFRGTAIVALLLMLVVLAVKFIEKPVEEDPIEDEVRELFKFEKQDLVKTVVTRPDGEVLTLTETEDGWLLEETGFRASKSMVNRVKHQLHDLTARASVVDEAVDPALYGLGDSAVHVELTFRDGRVESFRAGDPNPSSVSYYIQPDGDGAIYTVKKSAVDYYSLQLDEFRERRFAGFNSKDADRIAAKLPDGSVLELQRVGEKSWHMTEPEQMSVSLDEARSLLGRVAVLKAVDFVADQPEDLAAWGLAEPRAQVTVSFGTREPLTLLVGSEVEGDEEPSLSHMMVLGEGTVYTAKDSFLDDYTVSPDDLRDRAFVDMADDEVVDVLVTLHRSEDEPDLVGEVPLKQVGDVWTWYDGKPVPGSTPRRLAERAQGLEVEEFVGAPTNLAPYGLDKPVATLRLVSDTGTERVLLLGDEAPPRETEMEDERDVPRLYVKRADEPDVYMVDASIMSVVHDALREQRRKLKNDAERDERRDRLDEEMGTEPTDEPAPPEGENP